MSGYAEHYREEKYQCWLAKWVPRDDKALKDCPESFRDRYRSTLARARAAEHKAKEITVAVAALKSALDLEIRP